MSELTDLETLLRLNFMLNHQESEAQRRGKRPPLPPADLIRNAHILAKKEVESSSNFNYNAKNTLSNKIFASKTRFSQLERTSIPQLYLETSATGKYVIVRLIEEGYQVIGWNSVIEDDEGNVCGFGLYNYPQLELFPAGTVLVVKEPYFKIVTQGFQFIRCDCPTDIIVLTPAHPLYYLAKEIKWKNELCDQSREWLFALPAPSNAKQWKERGNSLFNKNQLILARDAYLLGLKRADENDPNYKLLLLNLTAVNFELGYFESVVKLCESVLEKYPDEKKALFRLGKAKYALRKYEESLKIFEKFREICPTENDGRDELKRASARVREMTTGKINVPRLRRQAAQNPTEELECADYVGPIEIVNIPGKGRGLVLTRDVDEDTVLIVSKALAATLDKLRSKGIQLDPGKVLDTDRDRSEIVSKITQLIFKNPNVFGPQVYNLSTGQQIYEEVPLFCDAESRQEAICDVELIKTICSCNNFGIENRVGGKVVPKGAGLFLFPSYLNHSCDPNVKREFCNDVMILTAAQRLEVGTELTTNYVALALDYEERSKRLNERGFQCQCEKCMRKV